MCFLPNLPNEAVRLVLISGEYPEIKESLQKLNIEVLQTDGIKSLPTPECFHADLQAVHIDEKCWVLNKSSNELILQFDNNNMKYTVSIKNAKEKYPLNIILNGFRLQNYFFCNTNFIDEKIEKHCANKNIALVHVSQGYTKCSSAIVGEQAIITADEAIAKAAQGKHIDVLKIKEGNISLPGYDYGFIGGCSGKIAKDCLAFCGEIEKHPEYKKIKDFSRAHGVYLHSLTKGQLLDIGSILPIK